MRLGRLTMAAAAAALLAGTAACGGSGSGADTGAAPGGERGGGSGGGGVVRALTAAAETTEEITSARFEAVTSSPASDGGEIEMSGAMSWGEALNMDVTVTGEHLSVGPMLPDEVALRWLDGVLYLDMGSGFADMFEGRAWMRMDVMDVVEETGDAGLTDAMSFGLEQANQDPARQLALLLQSPEIDRVGQERLDGVLVDHYRGTISVQDALAPGGGAGDELLTEEEREEIVELMEEQGVDSYEIDVWVNEQDFPVRIRQSYETRQGPVESEVTYHELGEEVTVEAPPAGSVIDFMDLLDRLESGFGLS